MKVALIGAGNVGYHLARQFAKANIEVTQVFSRGLPKASVCAAIGYAQATDSLLEITAEADVYILAVHDMAIQEVAAKLVSVGLSDKLLVHTSGATPTTVFAEIGLRRFGVFYPLQTMSRNSEPDFKTLPLCVYANTNEDLDLLRTLSLKICPNVYSISDEKRAKLHVAAVVVNNFTNHLFHIGHDIVQREGLPFDMLIPLIKETVAKLDRGTPAEMQTGPAKRGDITTIDRHLQFLEYNSEYRKVYEILTESIRKVSK